MTQFQIISEQGLVRRLKPKSKDLPPTPWLLKVEKGILSIGNSKILPVFVDYRFSIEEIPPNTIPIFSPLLSPDEEFKESNEYEYNLFLDRLEKIKFEGMFGIVFDPKRNSEEQLEDMLNLGPSIVSVKSPPLSKTSPKDWTSLLFDLRSRIPPDVAIYLPRTGFLGLNSFLIGMGIDIIDNSEAYLSALEGISFRDGFISREELILEELIKLNESEIKRDFEGILNSVLNNTIWQRIFRDMHASPSVATYVKHAVKKPLNYQKWGFSQTNRLMFIGDEALKHPEVIAFQNRLVDRYRIPKHKRVLVLLPCSAKKPYWVSKSHRLFEKSINKGFKGFGRLVEVWSLTSPMGVVPRELEAVYPARTYDIPVSGDWSYEEIKSSVDLLKNLLANVSSEIPVVVHVSEGYLGVIEELKKIRPITVSWAGARPASNTALKSLEETLKDLRPQENQRFMNKAMTQQWIDTVIAQVKWSHGINFELNQESWIFKGKPPRPIAIQKDKAHYATWDLKRGVVRLFPRAVLESNRATESWIMFDGENLKGSSLFIPGIKEASTTISPGDEVIIFDNENRPIGIGDAIVSGSTMNKASSGAGVKIRKKIEG